MSKKKVQKTFHELTNTDIESGNISQLYVNPDRGFVIVHCAILDELLKRMLKARLIAPIEELLDLRDEFEAFSSRIALCRALFLFSDEIHHELEIMRSLRNMAAHKIILKTQVSGKIVHDDFHFGHSSVDGKCKALKLCDRVSFEFKKPPADKEYLDDPTQWETAKKRFWTSQMMIQIMFQTSILNAVRITGETLTTNPGILTGEPPRKPSA